MTLRLHYPAGLATKETNTTVGSYHYSYGHTQAAITFCLMQLQIQGPIFNWAVSNHSKDTQC